MTLLIVPSVIAQPNLDDLSPLNCSKYNCRIIPPLAININKLCGQEVQTDYWIITFRGKIERESAELLCVAIHHFRIKLLMSKPRLPEQDFIINA